MLSRFNRRLLSSLLVIAVAFCLFSCAASLGPGYTIEKQQVRVQFDPGSGSAPRIRVDTDFELRNTGNQPLSSLEVRLTARRRFHIADSHATWDGVTLAQQDVPGIPRNSLFVLPEAWNVNARHTLQLSAEFQNPSPEQPGFRFSSNAFFLPSQGWAPELLPSRGFFATGGIPPDRWFLQVRVPKEFLVHTSGGSPKTSRKGGQLIVQSIQRPVDRFPFVVAGLYKQTQLDTSAGKVLLWTSAPEDAAHLQQSADALASAIRAYDSAFGSRRRNSQFFWIVECPAMPGCFTAAASSYAALLNASPGAVSSELASFDTLMMDFSGEAPKLSAAAPALAASWLGYGQNPGFYEQQPPLAALPAFASALGQEAIDGPSSRTETIRRALRMIPMSPSARAPETESVLRAKSFLFFFALQDRYGRDVFRRAINHMLSARQGRGFNLSDLIASFEEETHQNVAEFERLWMKRPGVPEDFRARYKDASSSSIATSKETMP